MPAGRLGLLSKAARAKSRGMVQAPMLPGTMVSVGKANVSELPSTRCLRGGKAAKGAVGATTGKVAALVGKEVVALAGKEVTTPTAAGTPRLVLVQRQAEVLLLPAAAYLHGHSPTVLREPATVAADRQTRKKSTATPTSTTQLLIRNTAIER